jgi:hypothetical protein
MRVGKPVALVVIVTIMTAAVGGTLGETVAIVAGAKAAARAVIVAVAVWMLSTAVVSTAKRASRGSDTVWALLVAAAAGAVWLI